MCVLGIVSVCSFFRFFFFFILYFSFLFFCCRKTNFFFSWTITNLYLYRYHVGWPIQCISITEGCEACQCVRANNVQRSPEVCARPVFVGLYAAVGWVESNWTQRLLSSFGKKKINRAFEPEKRRNTCNFLFWFLVYSMDKTRFEIQGSSSDATEQFLFATFLLASPRNLFQHCFNTVSPYTAPLHDTARKRSISFSHRYWQGKPSVLFIHQWKGGASCLRTSRIGSVRTYSSCRLLATVSTEYA